ncbi:MAG: hypothetical protein F6K08_30775 [Okeania sp. SIO1H6]|nr:hypothetical protein [Okeania sp. SIO1H6]
MVINDINDPQYSIFKQRTSNGKWRFRNNGTAIIYCGKASPLQNPFETVGNFKQEVWDDTKTLAVEAVRGDSTPPRLTERWPQANGGCSTLLHNILEVSKMYHKGQFPDASKLERMVLLYDNRNAAGHVVFIKNYILWVQGTYILEDYFVNDYAPDPLRFEGMEYVVGYDGQIY